jgi:hypothetical protein
VSKEFHSFSVDKKNVFEIDSQAVRFLFEYAPKYVDIFPRNPAAHEQHHEIFGTNDSIDSAAHLWAFLFNPSIPCIDRGSRRNDLTGFPALPGVCFTKECQGRRFAAMCDANAIMALNLAACHQIRERMDEQPFDGAF